MFQGELSSSALAVVAATVLAPLLGLLLSRLFPPTFDRDGNPDLARHRLRNQLIEYAGAAFFGLGVYLVFVVNRSSTLEPTVSNAAMMFSFGLLCMVGGTVALGTILGDKELESFLAYFEHERRIGRKAVRTIAKLMVLGSVLAILAVLISK